MIVQKQNLKINASITDFSPLLLGMEYLFKGLKETGVDGVELVIGVKSRWSLDQLASLSKKYNLPIASVHQPIWSGIGYFDEGLIKKITQLGIRQMVFHPLAGVFLQSERMREYFKKLARVKKEYNIDVLIENMPEKFDTRIINYFFSPKDSSDIIKLFDMVEKFDLNMTFDTSHAMSEKPHEHEWFKKIFPRVRNIHLSSFDRDRVHLPLDMGTFHTKEFISYLYKMNYSHLITLEIQYPSLINLFHYDFSAIKTSVELLRSI